jgi:hypothetical protein
LHLSGKNDSKKVLTDDGEHALDAIERAELVGMDVGQNSGNEVLLNSRHWSFVENLVTKVWPNDNVFLTLK